MNESSGAHVAEMIKQINSVLNRRLREKCKQSNLTIPQWYVLQLLGAKQTMTLSDISEYMLLANSTVSGIVERMADAGLVYKQQSARDRRAFTVGLTDEGTQLLERFRSEYNEYLEQLLAAAPEEMEQIVLGLEALQRLLTSK